MIECSFYITYHTTIITESIANHLLYSNFHIIDSYFKPLFESKLDPLKTFWVQAVENNKTLATCEAIFERLSQANIKRGDVIMGIGGGLTLDITSFCTSQYKRGCQLCLVPTTLIAMVDACIGGKTAVNLNQLKNQIGGFYPANTVILDYQFLNTLPECELKNGYAELIKTMLIFERDFFTREYAFIQENLQAYISKALNYKLELCMKDVSDKGVRQQLNLGHTFAHLYESVTNYRISHGEAVALGLLTALQYSVKLGLLSAQDQLVFAKYITAFCNVPVLTAADVENIKQYGKDILLADKKAGDCLRLVLINGTGVELVSISNIDEVLELGIRN